VQFTLDLWIVTIHISVEIGATLYLEGPPMGGRVHVDFWVFGFDIDFGGDYSGSDAIGLDDFYKLVLQDKTVSSTSAPNDTDEPVPHVFSANAGLIPDGSQQSDPNADSQLWKVRVAVFQFTVGCKFAIDSATIQTGVLPGNPEPAPVQVPPLPNTHIWSKPMHLETDPLSSTVTITITPQKEQIPPKSKRVRLWAHGADDDADTPIWDANTPVVKSLPTALWGACTSHFLCTSLPLPRPPIGSPLHLRASPFPPSSPPGSSHFDVSRPPPHH
jgi:hypothetical protein